MDKDKAAAAVVDEVKQRLDAGETERILEAIAELAKTIRLAATDGITKSERKAIWRASGEVLKQIGLALLD